jgi:hypothetical protein
MFVSVKFQPRDSRTYTYTYEGAQPLHPGDMVKVDSKDGTKTVSVVAVNVPKPPFACKPIVAVLAEGGL